jgi:alpha-galactosidase
MPVASSFRRAPALLARASLAALLVAGAASAAAAAEPDKTVTRTEKLAGLDVQVVGNLQGFTLALKAQPQPDGVQVISVELQAPAAREPPPFALKWSVPSHDVAGQWTPARNFDKGVKPDWARSRLEPSMFARSAPVACLFGNRNQNVLTFAVSDAERTILAGAGVREEDGFIYNEVQFFTEPHAKLARYTAQLRIDRRPVAYHAALGDVAAWWARQPGYQPAAVPPDALRPMYSTWYNYHQSLDPKVLLAEMALAKQLGMDTIIVDDGWQTLDSKRGYAFTGDWAPERMPDMKGFVEACHKLGVKVVLWYAVPYVGKNARVAERFKNRSLRFEERQGAYVLDPRYPEVRSYVIGIYQKALRDWGLDGFKLDFIERFAADDKTVLTAADGRDFASVNEAADRMMTDVLSELRKQRPEVMIEFRQPYIGPLIRKYGNMFRAGDCPNSYLANRVRTIDLRLLSGTTAVHADMIMWHPGEPVQAAALQLLNILFSVPQVSVRLRELPKDHLAMLTFYLKYWSDNRDVLLSGKLEPLYPAANYPVVVATSAAGAGKQARPDKQIVGLYGDSVVSLAGAAGKRIDVVNAKASEPVVLSAAAAQGRYRYLIRDCQGRTVKQGVSDLRAGVVEFRVPPSGLLSLERQGG